ncbi:MAG: transposase [Candidatus Portnoybacteria bacterium]|nr:transposase [Candidatus Portnoybacteria bacterium]MDD4982841.1 transposase [Candidatus Portnoybacteria bacterium]
MTEIYHVLNRGVDKRKIFMDDKDRFRFIHDLFEFNDQQRVQSNFYKFNAVSHAVRVREIRQRERKLLVKIHAFCLMPNHYHLLLSPAVEKGIALFMQKLNGGYVQYFNQRRERTGTLFERKYKSVLVENRSHFIHLPYYIHLNPLDLAAPEWREGKIKDSDKAWKFLNKYKWSSHLDYLGEYNFPSVTQRDFLLEVFGGKRGYEKSVKKGLNDLSLESVRGVILE